MTFTDAPDLHPHPVCASLQLLFWLTFRPSAWRAYMQRLSSEEEADISLLHLTRTQRTAARPLLLTLIASPLLATLIIILLSWLVGGERLGLLNPEVVITITHLFTATGAIVITLTICGGIFVGWGMVVSLLLVTILALAWQQLSALPLFQASPDLLNYVSRIAGVGFASGVIASVSISVSSGGRQRYEIRQQLGAVIVGIFVSGVILGAGLGLALVLSRGTAGEVISGQANHIAGIVPLGLSAGIALGIGFVIVTRLPARRSRKNILTGIAFALLVILTFLLAANIPKIYRNFPVGVGTGILFSVMYIFPFQLARRLAGVWAGAAAGAIGCGSLYALALIATGNHNPLTLLLSGILSSIIGLSFSFWRPLLFYPFAMAWNTLIFYLDRQRPPDAPRLLHWHSAFWDEQQRLPLYGLDNYLVWIATPDPATAKAAMAYLTTGHQRWAAQAASIELEARRMESCTTAAEIAGIHKHLGSEYLSESSTPVFASFKHLSQDTQAALNQTIRYHQRLTLHEIAHRLELLSHELQRSNNLYATRFFPIALRWQQIITTHAHELTRQVDHQQEIDNPYIFGVPLTAQQHIFVGRTDISRRIEQQILDQRHPPLFLDGQRRMGKTSLLHNLGRLLPNAIVPLYVDGQGLAGCQNYADLLYNAIWQMRRSAMQHRRLTLPDLARDSLADKPFPAFNDWLRQVEDILAQENQAVGLLIFDEFEALDAILRQRGLDETAIMNLLRHLIQHRPTFRLLFASSHPLEMFDHWASYLINTQVLHLSYLQEPAVRQLVERPIPRFGLHYAPAASDYICHLTRGHPHLVQLLCYEIVNAKNEQPVTERFVAGISDIETAVARALKSGRFFFVDIERNQVGQHGLNVLRFLAGQSATGPLPLNTLRQQFGTSVDATLHQLQQRELIEPNGAAYQFQVEMIRRWFA